MAEDERSRNEIGGTVAGSVFQAGAVYGDVVFAPSSAGRSGDEPQARLTQQLANQVRALSKREGESRRIGDPRPLSIQWHTAAEDLIDHWDNIHGEAGQCDSEPMSLAGRFTDIRETYDAVPSGRLVILGRAGAGKTVLAHRLIIALLNDDTRSGPVPVLFSLSAWNARSTGLRNWLVHQLVRDYPFLDARDRTGESDADVLVDGDWILPVLDGFDEIPEQHHSDAISEISRFDGPLVVTSRSGEYTRAARAAKALGRAVAIELDDLALGEIEQYLQVSASKTRTADWHTVFGRLRTAPDDAANRNLTSVLATPLMVMLARTTYNDTTDHDPAELLDTHRFPTSEDIEEHLLGAYLDTLYDRRNASRHRAKTPNWNPGRTNHWLGYLATHLTKLRTHDLTWWQLLSTLRPHTRIFTTMCMLGLVGGLIGMLGLGLATNLLGGPATWFVGGPSVGLMAGLAIGIANEVRVQRKHISVEPERLRLRIRLWRNTEQPRHFLGIRRLAAGFVTGFAFGLAIGLAGGMLDLATGLVRGFTTGLAVGPVTGLATGLMNVVLVALGDSHDPREAVSPWQLLRTDRTVTLVRAILAGIAVGLAVGLTDGILGTTVIGLIAGFAVGPGVTLDFLLLSTWGTWLLFGRVWLPLTGRLPWRVKRFLEDAYDRGVLRQAGAVYQFRHAQLRDHLARRYQS